MRKYVFHAAAVAVVVALAAFGGWSLRKSARSSVTYPGVSAGKVVAGTDAEAGAVDAAWAIWGEYLDAAKRHDLAAFKKHSYKLSDACANPATEKDCFARMDSLYETAKDLMKADFPSAWGDSKQLVFVSAPVLIDGGGSRGKGVTYLYFAQGADGALKPLRLVPLSGIFRGKSATSTDEEIDKDIDSRLIDSDKDGKMDEIETCKAAKDKGACLQTDPFDFDSDDDGWWDGVEQYLQ